MPLALQWCVPSGLADVPVSVCLHPALTSLTAAIRCGVLHLPMGSMSAPLSPHKARGVLLEIRQSHNSFGWKRP